MTSVRGVGRICVAASILLLLPGAAIALHDAVAEFCTKIHWVPMAIGAIVVSSAHRRLGRRFAHLMVAEHELTHAWMAMLLRRKVMRIAVRADQGYVIHTGKFGGTFGDDMIALAPYMIPMLTIAMVLARPLLRPVCFPWYDVLVGAAFSYDTVRNLREFSAAQPDIKERGIVYSAVFAGFVTVVLYGLLVSIIAMGYPGIVDWVRRLAASECRCFRLVF